MLINEVVSALNARKSGKYYIANCPLCRLDKPTLNIWLGDDGKIGIRCYYSIMGQCHSVAHVYHLQALGIDIDINDLTGSKQVPSDTWSEIWHGAQPVMGSYADEYLFHRGIDIRRLPPPFLDNLRCVPRLKHPSGVRTPSMISLLSHPSTKNELAIHRTYLNPLGTGKLDVDPNKMTLGPAKGGVVKFGQPKHGIIYIGEGIETCLSAWLLGIAGPNGGGVWATTSVGGLLQLEFPEEVKNVYVLVDMDMAGMTAAKEAISHYRIPIHARTPKTGYKDFNDELRGQ